MFCGGGGGGGRNGLGFLVRGGKKGIRVTKTAWDVLPWVVLSICLNSKGKCDK